MVKSSPTRPIKESQLKKLAQEISAKLKESKIVDICYRVVRERGQGESKVHTFYTSARYDFETIGLAIHLTDGWSEMGGGEIEVDYDEKRVLYGDRYSCDKTKPESAFIPTASGFGILEYHPGVWEKEVRSLLKQQKIKPKKRSKPVDKEVKLEVLRDFHTRFSRI